MSEVFISMLTAFIQKLVGSPQIHTIDIFYSPKPLVISTNFLSSRTVIFSSIFD